MNGAGYHVGQRLSLKKQLCTVRYVGSVADKSGDWLGVEWDDTTRGKHDGTHEGVKYFSCRSKALKAASFLRPVQQWDPSRSFLQALREKYIAPEKASNGEIVFISGKQAEEVGFDKFARRQAELRGIFVLVLDRLCIRHTDITSNENEEISALCANIADLDLGGNLFETYEEIIQLCQLLPKLRALTLDGNRFTVDNNRTAVMMPAIRSLSLSGTLMDAGAVSKAAEYFPRLESLTVASNEYTVWSPRQLPQTLRTLELSANGLQHLSDVQELSQLPTLTTLLLKRNCIEFVSHDLTTKVLSSSLEELDLAQNGVKSWSFFSDLRSALPSLRSLRLSGNTLYTDLKSAENKPLTAEDGYMLTIARLPLLETLNYSKVTAKERLNAETYYLNQIALEASNAPVEDESLVLSTHPRWKDLCEEYGEPTISRKSNHDEIDPNSLAARLVVFTFKLAGEVASGFAETGWSEELPKSSSIYALHGAVAKRLKAMPLKLRLVWETGERDPAGRNGGYTGPEWWDSSDDEDVQQADDGWVAREVELVPGTRAIGTYIEARGAAVRIETR